MGRRSSGGQEGGRVVWGDGLGAEGDEVGVVGGGEGEDGLGGGEGLLAEGFGLATLCGVEDEDAVSEGGGRRCSGRVANCRHIFWKS